MSNDFDLISDLHKDARGFRPSGEWLEHFDALPATEKQRMWDGLCDELRAEELHEQRRRAPSQQIAVLRRHELTDGSTVTDVQLMDPDGNVLVTIACLGFTHAIDVRDAINRNAAYVEVP